MNEPELVFSHILNCDRLSLYLNKGICLDQEKSRMASDILLRRAKGEPVQYILGITEFMGLKIKIDKRALIPRPETEILVESAAKELKAKGLGCPKILDLGTGSGCIAISLAKLFPLATIWAVDISDEALQLAKENAKLNQAKIEFLKSDIFEGLKNNKFDLIISNPPYVSTNEFSNLAREIYFEPQTALKAGPDGLDFYRKIINRADTYLNADGLLALEVGINQSDAVKGMLLKEKFSDIKIIKDYNNIERVVITKKL